MALALQAQRPELLRAVRARTDAGTSRGGRNLSARKPRAGGGAGDPGCVRQRHYVDLRALLLGDSLRVHREATTLEPSGC